MLFNSFIFLVFISLFFPLYWLISKKIKLQNIFIIFASYIFYGFWDWRFLFLIFFSSIVDFTIGYYLNKTDEKKRKWLFYTSLLTNLGLLGFFKYYNFFVESFIDLFLNFGITLESSTLNIILPVGISFYTFQTLSYTIDIYNKKLKPTNDIFEFFAFVSFFPQLVAGPIERATDLLPQFKIERKFNITDLKIGLQQVLAGFFKKMVIADNCAPIVNQIFDMPDYNNSLVLVFGAFFFAFQIYADFSGYSDIGIGISRMLGFKLNRNFNYPYFSSSVRTFWQNWHISLSSWFRDYVYIPLGGSRKGKNRTIINLILTFTLSGLWHGANLTFIIWGLLNGIYLVIEYKFINKESVKAVSKGKKLFKVILTFILINLTWIFFRANDLDQAKRYILGILNSLSEPNMIFDFSKVLFPKGYIALLLILIFVFFEFINRKKAHFLEISHLPFFKRIFIYFTTIIILIMFGSFFGKNEFIYFQF